MHAYRCTHSRHLFTQKRPIHTKQTNSHKKDPLPIHTKETCSQKSDQCVSLDAFVSMVSTSLLYVDCFLLWELVSFVRSLVSFVRSDSFVIMVSTSLWCVNRSLLFELVSFPRQLVSFVRCGSFEIMLSISLLCV